MIWSQCYENWLIQMIRQFCMFRHRCLIIWMIRFICHADWDCLVTLIRLNWKIDHESKLCDEEDTAIRDQIVMLIDSWSKCDLCVSHLCVYEEASKQASKQAKKSICEWSDSRSGQAQYRTFVSSLDDVITWHIFSALKKLNNLASHFRISAENQLFRRTVLSFSSFSDFWDFWNVSFCISFCICIVVFLIHLLFSLDELFDSFIDSFIWDHSKHLWSNQNCCSSSSSRHDLKFCFRNSLTSLRNLLASSHLFRNSLALTSHLHSPRSQS